MTIEICPKCGADIKTITILTYPGIPRKVCTNPNCDWSWEGERETITRVPFNTDAQSSNVVLTVDVDKIK